jgi:RNA recognition motif-containing protein
MTQLWIGNTELWESEEQVISVIRQKCNIAPRSVWFSRNRTSNQLDGFGFIQFETTGDAAQVMRLLKDAPIPHSPSHRIRLNWGNTRPDGESEVIQQAAGFQVYVGNLPSTMTDDKLIMYFRRHFPQALSARLIHGPDGISRGFGFVRFNTFREVTDAIRLLNGSTELGRPIKVSEATTNRVRVQEQGSDPASATLFIRDIDPEIVKEETLLYHFRPYGNVLKVKVIPGHPDWANVTMETHVEAESAKNALQGSRFGGTTKCDIQFGRAFDEATVSKQSQITVPVLKPKKSTRKLQAEYFGDAGIERVAQTIQRYAELKRPAPLEMTHPEIANRKAARSALENDAMLFGWNCGTDCARQSNHFLFY